jgi:hypothetical protein
MRINDIIRSVLDIIDQVDTDADQPNDTPAGYDNDDLARFKQIAGIAGDTGEMSVLANSPNEEYADIDAVTTNAGGGVNGPKHPADIRGDHPSMYPASQWRGE